ncbi:MAG: GerW family sporulation protein [Niameybacter sp.]|uniref:GerW family sporulation protein n=1 Tax=Niameybacter sp. TaxID=2033640 RepID=UPI002FC771E3
MESKLNNNLEVLLGQLEHFINTKTVVGEPIHIADTILVPLVDVSFGVGAGAAAATKLQERNKDKEKNIDGNSDKGAGGLGARITPSAMLVIQNGTTQLINIKAQDSLSKLIDMVPGLVSNLPDMMSKFTHKETTVEKPADDAYHQMNQ